MFALELRRKDGGFRRGGLGQVTPGLRCPIVVSPKMPRASSRLGGDSCGCIISGANTSMPMLTMVPLNSGEATPTTVRGWPFR